MNKKEINYWLREFDRFGLFFIGIFIGGLIEAIGIPKLSIIISVALITCLGILSFFLIRLKDKLEDEKENSK